MTEHQQHTTAIHALDFTRINPYDGEPLPANQRAYKAKSGRLLIKPSIELILELGDEGAGFCIACGHHEQFAEPDMERGECEHCGEAKVYGAAELGLRGLYF